MGYVSRLDAYSTGSWRTRRDRVPRWGRRWKKGRLTYALCGERLALGRTRHEFALVGQRFRILVCSVVCHFELRSVTKDGPLSKFRQQAGKIRGFGFYNSENETNPNHSVNITHETTTDDERWILFSASGIDDLPTSTRRHKSQSLCLRSSWISNNYLPYRM
jgi:hypothetical protein